MHAERSPDNDREGRTMSAQNAPTRQTAGRGYAFIIACLGAVLALAAPSHAGATPINKNTIYLSGECGGVPVTMADPSSGPSAFVLASGKPAVGRIFRLIYTPTQEVAFEDAYGKSYANETLTECNFTVPADVSPDGTPNWLFQVEVWFPQAIQ
jgi:hypothetical protein